jgi:hypothetical protein
MTTQELAVDEHPDASGTGSETSPAPNGVRYYKRDFWSRENLNYAQPHFRLEKAARIVNRMAGGKSRDLLVDGGKFLASYVNFHHRQPLIYDPYSNVQPLRDFRGSLASQFRVHRYFATSHNWKHSEPSRAVLRAVQMPLRLNLPLVSRVLAVEYFFICSSKKGA